MVYYTFSYKYIYKKYTYLTQKMLGRAASIIIKIINLKRLFGRRRALEIMEIDKIIIIRPNSSGT